MEIGLIGGTGVRVSVITLQEQEHGTELDLVPTHHLLAMERKGTMSPFVIMKPTKNRLLH